LAVTRVIVNDIVDFRAQGGSLPHNFWWLVAWNSHWPEWRRESWFGWSFL